MSGVVGPRRLYVAGARLMPTGQTISYASGDDGDNQFGRPVDFLTLQLNNPFGNTNRFTDELGGQTYTNDIVIDWSTYDGYIVLGWYMDFFVETNWSTSMTAAQGQSIGGFSSGWRLPNRTELLSIVNIGVTSVGTLNYPPFNYTGTQYNVFTSSTDPLITTRAFILTLSIGTLGIIVKTAGGPRYKPCRNFTVNGTNLT